MNDRFPGLAKFIPVFMVKIVRMFFDFESFAYDSRSVIGCRGQDFGFVKTNWMFRIERVFGNIHVHHN